MSTPSLPDLPELGRVVERLPEIFPEGMELRNYFIRQMAARTIFVMFYVGAVEGFGRWIRPNQVTRMSDEQAGRAALQERLAWTEVSLRKGGDIPGRWFADNTREPIRDETIRHAFVRVGAILERPGVPTTSSKPRYALASDFAELFLVDDPAFPAAVSVWQERHLTAAARARVELVRRGIAARKGEGILVTFPNGETRRMKSGESSEITRSVIEDFASRFLEMPGVVWVSESGQQVVQRDDELARRVGLTIPAQTLLPDVILVDLAPVEPLLVFVEVVATDGPVNDKRKEDLLTLVTTGGHRAQNAAFVTAYSDRSNPAFRKTGSTLAWDSLAWFASEPDRIMMLISGSSSI